MKTISDNIKKNEFKHVYLLHGEEEYLKKQYRNNLKEALVGDDTMNYSYYEGADIKLNELLDVCDTMPFFSERRLVILENSGFIKSSNEALADYIKNMPDYLYIVFVEKEIDKRNKVYKAIDTVGYISEMKPQTTATLKKWIVGLLSEDNLKITEAACELLLSKTGAGMDLIKQEIEKLVCYCNNREYVDVADVEAICSTQTEGHIFDMIEAIGNRKQQKALDMYYDLLTLKEPPMRILYLITRHFNGMLQAKELISLGISGKDMASKMGVAPFIAGKYKSQAQQFEYSVIKDALHEFAEVEESVKQGRLNDKLAVELMIIKYSK